MTLVITPQMAMEALFAVVEKKGSDYIDPAAKGIGAGCKYVRADCTGPACIIGTALTHLGVDLGVLASIDGLDDPLIETGGWLTLEENDVDLHWQAMQLFSIAQKFQDQGGSWGASLGQAKIAAKGWGVIE